MGYIPQYSNDPALLKIAVEPPRSIVNAGKIYTRDKYIYQCEVGEGVHVTDKSDLAQTKRVSFIKIRGVTDISIKGNYLYCNSFYDLVVIDITNINSVAEVKRIAKAFLVDGYNVRPPEFGCYYECVNPDKGVVVGWKKDSVAYSSCYNNIR